MNQFEDKTIEFLKTELETNTNSHIFLWHGIEGSGKSYLAKKYCDLNSACLYLKIDQSFSELEKLFVKNTFIFKKNNLVNSIVKYIKRKHIKYLFFDLHSNDNLITYCEVITQIMSICLRDSMNFSIVWLIDKRENMTSIHKNLSANFKEKLIKPISINMNLSLIDWKNILEEEYGANNISDDKLKLITEYSKSNIGLFLKQLFYLKSYGIFKEENNIYVIDENFDLETHLAEVYHGNIEQRYTALDLKTQKLLQKTSVIGDSFSLNVLTKAFDITNALSILHSVEIATKLIEFTDKNFSNGKFESQSVRNYLKKLIPENEYISACYELAQYYQNNTEQYELIDIKRIETYQKCAFYYFEAENYTIYVKYTLALISLLYSFEFYESAIVYGQELLKFLKTLIIDNNFTLENLSELLWILYKANLIIHSYNKSLYYFNKYINFSDKNYLIIDSIESKYLLGELYYNCGKINESYKVMSELEKKLNTCSQNMQIRILNMLSSIEETLDIPAFEKHYLKALNLAKDYDEYLYYQLLRKSNFLYHNKTGINYLLEAKNYFEDKSTLEFAFCNHNLATESMLLCLDNMDDVKQYLDVAYDNLNKSGCNDITYTNNSYAIYYILKEDYNKALKYIDKEEYIENEPFIQLAFLLNKCTCLRKIGKTEDAKESLQKAQQLNNDKTANFPYYHTIINLQYLLFAIEENDTSVINQLLLDVNDTLSFKGHFYAEYIDALFSNKDNYENNDITKYCAKNHILVCDLMFWE